MAEHFGVPVLYVRIAFVATTWFNGAGLIAYALLWRFLPLAAAADRSPGLAAAARRGERPAAAPQSRSTDVVQTFAILAVGAGVLWLLEAGGIGIGWAVLAPLLLAVGGLALIWRQFDDVTWSRWMFQTSGLGSMARMALGATMVAVAGLYFVTQERGWSGVADVVSALAVAVVGLALILGPWIYKLSSELSTERRERLRTQERADVAAHLHDSVLQTLVLLQKNAADPAAVATLARRQERELRDWLYGDDGGGDDSLVAAVKADAAAVESDHRVVIEVVAVGDIVLDQHVRAAAQAAREAMTNAAKHSGVNRIDVYLEVGAESVDIFVRDRGCGFDPLAIAGDRMGIRRSIIERVKRHRGTVDIKSSPATGTEVHIALAVHNREDHNV